jgi:hypothetical protein
MGISSFMNDYYGGSSGTTKKKKKKEPVSDAVRVGKEVGNLETRLHSVGQSTESTKHHPLISILQNLSRPGYGVMNAVREYTNPFSGATPGVRDPLKAFARGFSLEEPTRGKDIMRDLGASDKPYFKAHIGPVTIAPNTAGLLGTAADLLNPLDPLNWVGFGVGKAGKLGAQSITKGYKLAERSFGKEAAGELAEKLGRDWMDTVDHTPTVGALVSKLSDRANKLGIDQGVNPARISELMQQGLGETGLKAGSRIQEKYRQALKVGIQAPIVNKHLATVDLPGSSQVMSGVGSLVDKLKATPFGQAVGQSFSTNFVPQNVPAGVWTRFMRQGATKPPTDISNLLPNRTQDIIEGVTKQGGEDVGSNAIENKARDLLISPTMQKRVEDLKNKFPGMFDHITPELAEKNENLVETYRDVAKNLQEIHDNFRVANFDNVKNYLQGNYERILDKPAELSQAVRNELKLRIKDLNTKGDILENELYGNKSIPLTDLKQQEGNEAYSQLTQGLKGMTEKSRIKEQYFERNVADVFKGIDENGRKQIMKAAINPDVPLDDGLQPALDAFKQWRTDVVNKYRENGVSFTPLEEYVPFIATGKPLTKDEMGLLRGLFGTGIKEAQSNDLLEMVGKMDPHLRERTTKAIDPAEINKVLGREWLTEDAAVAMARRGVKAIRGEEAATFLGGMAQKYGLTIDNVNELKNLPEGYVVIEPHPVSSGRIMLEPEKEFAQGKAMALPQEFVKSYNDYVDLLFNPEAQTKLGKFFDQVTRAYKTVAYMWNPGHVPRDFMSNVYNLWLADVRSPIPYAQAGKVMAEAADKSATSLFTFPKWEGTGKELYQTLEELGVTDSGSVLAEFMQAGSDWSFRIGGKYTDVMRKITRANDNYARVAGAIDFMTKGATPEQAAAQVKKYLFDYFDLTPFERKFMKRVVPFYTWLRKNLPLQVETMLSKPGKYATTYRATEDIGDIPSDTEAPSFIRDAGGFRVGADNGKGGTYLIPNMSYADLGKIPMSFNDVRGLLGMINPILRAPIEQATNVSLFSGQPLENYGGEREKIPFGQLIEKLGVKSPTVSKRGLGYALDQIPPLRTAATIANPESPRQMARLVSVLGGPQIYPVDWARTAADYERRDELRALVRQLEAKGKTVPTIKELTPKKPKKKGSAALGGISKYMKAASQLK